MRGGYKLQRVYLSGNTADLRSKVGSEMCVSEEVVQMCAVAPNGVCMDKMRGMLEFWLRRFCNLQCGRILYTEVETQVRSRGFHGTYSSGHQDKLIVLPHISVMSTCSHPCLGGLN